MKKTIEREQVSISLDKTVLEYLDIQSKRLRIARSRLIENCVLVAVDDMKLLEKLGLIDAAIIIKKIQERMRKELKALTA